MKKKIVFIIIICLLILTSGCSVKKNNEKDIISHLEYGETVRVTVALNDYIYEVTDSVISSEGIGEQIGSVKRQVSPKPEDNGDIARNTPEGPKIIGFNGGKLYEIKSIDSKDQIALENPEGSYFQCNNIGRLK